MYYLMHQWLTVFCLLWNELCKLENEKSSLSDLVVTLKFSISDNHTPLCVRI